MHWQRWRRHGDPMAEHQMSPLRDIDEKIDFHLGRAVQDGDCLIVSGGMNTEGYKQIRVDGRLRLLHRLVLERSIGRELGPEDLALHSCHRPNCCQVSHLRVGTKKDNSDDMFLAEREKPVKGVAHPSAKLSEDDVREIRRKFDAGGYTFASLGRQYGVAYQGIRQIVRRRTWKHVA